jgi:mannose-6-phosphate isomerase
MSLIFFRPIYQPRVWGGRAFAEKLGRTLPQEGPIGESWEIVDRPEAQSIDCSSGKTLRRLIQEDPEGIMGPGFDPAQPFPILVKWLDCRERLSLQVHPPSTIATKLGGEPKTECWYIAEADPHAALIVGLDSAISREEFEQAVANEALEPLLHRFPVQPGQAMLLESGRLHAIDGGNLILEIQQNSDTTYRVYDWGRKGLDGKPRQLHPTESLQSIDFEDIQPTALQHFDQPGTRTLADCPEFRLRQFNLQVGESLALRPYVEARILSVVSGTLLAPKTAQRVIGGVNALLPFRSDIELQAQSSSTVLVTDRFMYGNDKTLKTSHKSS